MEYELTDSLNFVDEVAEHSKQAEHLEAVPSKLSKQVCADGKRFDREILEICQKHGDLEKMREKLNISRRQICEYLMVDASAWSRWTNGDRISAPPHVYRTMALIMEQNLQDQKSPPVKSKMTAEARAHNSQNQSLQNQYLSQIESLRESLDATIKKNEKYEILTMGWKIILILNSILLLYVLFR